MNGMTFQFSCPGLPREGDRVIRKSNRFECYAPGISDVYSLLGAEQAIAESLPPGSAVFVLGRTKPALVWGRFQNPRKECDLDAARGAGVHLARRRSGGGTVFLDPGTLVFSLIVSREFYRLEDVFDIVRRALALLEIRSEVRDDKEIAVRGFKVSGNAFQYFRRSVLHHGTLLVSCDLECMERLLRTDFPWEIRDRSVASVPKKTANLRDFYPGLDPDRAARALFEAFGSAAGRAVPVRRHFDAAVRLRAEKHAEAFRDAGWIEGRERAFSFRAENRFAWGAARVRLDILNGTVRDAAVSGLPDPGERNRIERLLKGAPFDHRALSRRVGDRANASRFGDDVARWFGGLRF